VCGGCASRLAGDLRTYPSLAAEVWINVARLNRQGKRTRGCGDRPLPFDWDASVVLSSVDNTITTWARDVAETQGVALAVPSPRPRASFVGPMPLLPLHTTADVAPWLAGKLDWLRTRPQAGEAWDELGYAMRLLVRTVDTPPVRWYAGTCGEPTAAGPCPAELYAPTGAPTVRCGLCGACHDAPARREWLLAQAADQLLHAGWMASALAALGTPVPVNTIRVWAHRGQIAAHGTDRQGRPVYRVADVLDRVRHAA